MRDNAKTMEALIKARSEKAGTMTAVDDLKSYGEIAEAHADGLKKFIPAFEPLYAGMSDAQKKSADTLFRHHGPHEGKGKGQMIATAITSRQQTLFCDRESLQEWKVTMRTSNTRARKFQFDSRQDRDGARLRLNDRRYIHRAGVRQG